MRTPDERCSSGTFCNAGGSVRRSTVKNFADVHPHLPCEQDSWQDDSRRTPHFSVAHVIWIIISKQARIEREHEERRILCCERSAVKHLGLKVIDLTKLELTGTLKPAIDNNFQRIVKNARNQWQQKFAGNDPADSCVSVKITNPKKSSRSSPVRASDFVKSRKEPAKRKSKHA
jgi:hypothetical protein